MNRLSINHYICPDDVTVPEFLDAVVAVGARAVGVTARAVAETGAGPLKAMLDERGLAVSSVNSAGYFAKKDGAPVDDHDRRMVEAAAMLDAGVLCVISGGRGPVRSVEAAQARVRDGLEALAEIARPAGVTLGVEPIHPVDLMTKGCVNSIADTLTLIDGIEGVGMILDINHSWWDPALPGVCRDHRDRVALFQLCNVVESEPSRPRREFSVRRAGRPRRADRRVRGRRLFRALRVRDFPARSARPSGRGRAGRRRAVHAGAGGGFLSEAATPSAVSTENTMKTSVITER